MFLYLIELIVMALFGLFVVTQMLVPALFYRPMFPLFRRRGKLEREIIEAREDADLAKMESNLEREKSQIETRKKIQIIK